MFLILISILTYNRYDSCFKASIHSYKLLPEIINIYDPGQNI